MGLAVTHEPIDNARTGRTEARLHDDPQFHQRGRGHQPNPGPVQVIQEDGVSRLAGEDRERRRAVHDQRAQAGRPRSS
jgi:hypothetical protein